jgi:uncharacterized protein YbjT (DUF2867 family)
MMLVTGATGNVGRELIGRPAHSFRDWADRNVNAYR